MAKLSFNELNLKNNAFLFAAALQDAETCQIILEIILGHPVPRVTVNTEHAVMFNSDLRSIRLDVYASDETQVGYNLEMQNETADSLAKRSRFYQSEMDVSKSGNAGKRSRQTSGRRRNTRPGFKNDVRRGWRSDIQTGKRPCPAERNAEKVRSLTI